MSQSLLRTFLFSGLIAFSFWSCSNQPKSNSENDSSIQNPTYGSLQKADNPFTFQLIETINLELPGDFILSEISSLQRHPNGDFFFMDRKQHKLISVNQSGDLRWMTGEKGRGPGDFESAYSMISDNEFIYVGNLQGARLDFFDTAGSFIKSINLSEEISFGYVAGRLESGELVFSTPYWESWGHHLFVAELHDDSVTIKHDFKINQAGEKKVDQGVTASATITVAGDKIYSGSLLDYSYEVYQPIGKLVQKVHRDFDRIVRPGTYSSGNSMSLWGFGGVDAPFPIGNDYLLVQAQWPTNISDPDSYVKRSQTGSAPGVKYQNSLDIFDPNGTLLYSFESDGRNPEIGSISLVDDAGHIYVAEAEPEPVIKKYKLVRN